MQTNVHFLSHLAQLFLEWEIFRMKVVEKIKTHILCSLIPPPPPPQKQHILSPHAKKN